MAISGVSSGSSATGGVSSSANSLATNYEAFLSLLTTQLKNQNPLDPMDTNQFTQQLVQFAGVEQQLKTNDTLSSLLVASQTAQVTSAFGLVGREITAFGDTTTLDEGKATWNLDSPTAGASGTVTIRDKNGAIVFTKEMDFKNGDQDFVWDGKRADGTKAPEGLYTISVDAKDVSGKPVEVTSEVSGMVDGVDLSTGQAMLLIGDIKVPLGSLKSVKAPKDA